MSWLLKIDNYNLYILYFCTEHDPIAFYQSYTCQSKLNEPKNSHFAYAEKEGKCDKIQLDPLE